VLSRRRILQGSAVFAALAAAGAGVVTWNLQPAPGAAQLSVNELEVVRCVALVFFPGAPFPLDGEQAGVPLEVDRILNELMHPLHARGFRALLQTLEWGTLASRGVRFSELPRGIQAEVLTVWGDPTVFERRVVADALRLVLGMAYFQDERILAHLGWRTGCSG
jgi:hypothetical protein